MDEEPGDHLLLVFNEKAGDGDLPPQELVRKVERAGRAVRLCASEPKAVRAGLDDQPAAVVAAGGDGTVAMVVAQASSKNVPVAPIPLGGLNNIAGAFGLEGDVDAVVAGWARARHARLDCGVVTGDWGRSSFVEAVGFGALTSALDDVGGGPATAGEKLAIGRAAFRRSLAEAQPREVTIVLDGASERLSALGVEAMNLPAIGPRLRLAPHANPSDGLLDVVVVTCDDRSGMIAWMDAGCCGPLPVRSRRAREIEVVGFDKVRVDDPRRGRDTRNVPVRITLAGSVTLMLPEEALEERT